METLGARLCLTDVVPEIVSDAIGQSTQRNDVRYCKIVDNTVTTVCARWPLVEPWECAAAVGSHAATSYAA